MKGNLRIPCLATLMAIGWTTILSCGRPPTVPDAERPPNFVIVFTDDQGYGDLGVYGHPSIRTPHLDRMAREGIRFTDFYSAASVCTPSRAALLTGRLPIRSGMTSDTRRVLFPDSAGGLPSSEITIARALKEAGYATAAVGKWHLGHLPEYLPTRHGFDYYFGIPYSNDMDRTADPELGRAIFRDPRIEYWNVPLMRNEEIIERPADQRTITRRYTEEAIRFVREHRGRPFFVYLAHSMPHVPLFASDAFLGTSPRGLYGDVIEEIDWSVGQILDVLREEGLARDTVVFFTSDNGPWLIYDEHGGSAGLLRDGKGTTWEGGMRVPALAWGPGRVAEGAVDRSVAGTLDLFPTFLAMAGEPPPRDRIIDGRDLSRRLRGEDDEAPDLFFFYRGTQVFAVRKGPFKAHFITRPGYGPGGAEHHDPPLLYHLAWDPGELNDVAGRYPEALADIRAELDRHLAELTPGEPQLEKRIE